MANITYLEQQSNWCVGQPFYRPPIERTVAGTISKKTDALGFFTIKPENGDSFRIHWMDTLPA
jgi:hypothetical protein